MNYFCIDTADWIELSLSLKLVEVRKKIEELITTGIIVLVLPQTIIDEWNKNKEERVIVAWQTSKRGAAKNARQILDLLPDNESEELRQALNLFLSDEEAFNSPIVETVNQIDALFSHPSTIVLNSSPSVISQSVEFALEQKAPFQKKNSMADALILFSYIEFVAGEPEGDFIFVSKNTADFADSKSKEEIHADLATLFNEYQIHYFSNIGKAINEIKEGIVDTNVVEEIERIHDAEETFRRFTEVNAATLAANQYSIGATAAMMDMMKPIKDIDLSAVSRTMESALQNFAALAAFQANVGATPAMMELMKPVKDVDLPAVSRLMESVSQNSAALIASQDITGASAALMEMMKPFKDIDISGVSQAMESVSQNSAALAAYHANIGAIAVAIQAHYDSITRDPAMTESIKQLSNSAPNVSETTSANKDEEE